jgi:hypothetical protein
LANLYVQHAYSEVLSREALDPVTREAVAIASLMNFGNYTQPILEHINGFVAQISIIWDSRHESSVIAGVYEQLDTYDVQDPELGRV